MTKTPNLYEFATKELAQDATIAYMLAWADPLYKDSHPRLHGLGTELLRSLLATDAKLKHIPDFKSVNVQTQVDRIDILVRINAGKNKNRIILIVEDKVSTQEHSNQIERYILTAKTKYDGEYDDMAAVYLKTGNESERNLPPREKCGRFLRRDLLLVLNRYKDTKNVIVNDFRTHLQRTEDATNSWTDVTYSSWSSHAIEGFYTALEESWRAKHTDWCGWGYVPNPSGGFLGWWGGSERIGSEERHVPIYLQIDDGTRLTVRLGSGNAFEKVRNPLMYEVLHTLRQVFSESPDDIRCDKAGRFRGGDSADVAKVTFGGIDPWFAVNAEELVDISATVDRLCRVRELLRRIAGDLTERGLIENG